MGIRKQVHELTVDDLTRYPVWEYALDEEGKDGQDETTVRPVALGEMDLQVSSYMVRARFHLADGTTAMGTVTVSGLPENTIGRIDGDIDGNADRQPVVFTKSGQVPFWFGAMKPMHKGIADAYLALGRKAPEAVFPIMYEVDVDLPVGPVGGRIGGFQYLENKAGWLDFVMREAR